MEINRYNVNEIVQKSGLKPDKDYGQNYLVEPAICQKIVDALEIKEDDHVLEIGPGIGSLTHFVNEKQYAKFDMVDIDQRMIDFLKVLYQKENNEIILSDIRKHDVSKYTKIVGNLPYNITTETVVYLLKNAKKADKMVLMCQTETFSHFYDASGKEYGPTSVLIHLLGRIDRNFNVKPGSFYPAPKCSSTVFTITFNKNADFTSAYSTYQLAKQLFLNRRKTIYNNLFVYLKDKDKANSILNNCHIEANKRPEEITPEQFALMIQRINTI